MHVYAMCSVCYTSMMLAMKALDINFWPFLFIIKKLIQMLCMLWSLCNYFS